jgi:hypothetical protein
MPTDGRASIRPATCVYIQAMPAYPKNGRCPICLKANYASVVVRKPSGGHYTTEFYECSGCSVMFRDPHEFIRTNEFRRYEEQQMAKDKWRAN